MEYLEYQKNYSDYTILSYKNDIEEFFSYLERESLSFLDINDLSTRNSLEKLLKLNLIYYYQKYLNKKENKILVIGLGNRNIVSDALGPSVVNHIEVNNHLENIETKIASLALGVMAQTGIETSDLLSSICKQFKPDLVILIDALATKSIKRIK